MADHDLNDLYAQIGKLQGTSEELLRQVGALFVKMDKQQTALNEATGVAKEALKMAASNQATIKDNVLPTIEDYKSMKNRGLGIVMFIGFLGSGVGAAITKYWSS